MNSGKLDLSRRKRYASFCPGSLCALYLDIVFRVQVVVEFDIVTLVEVGHLACLSSPSQLLLKHIGRRGLTNVKPLFFVGLVIGFGPLIRRGKYVCCNLGFPRKSGYRDRIASSVNTKEIHPGIQG